MPDLKDILRGAGFSGSALDTAYAIAMAESGGNAKAFNGNTNTGDQSYGLFQINMLGGMGPERRAQYGLSSNDALYNAATNAKVAYEMSKGGTDWSPWSTYKRGDYKKYLGQTGASVSGAGPAGDANAQPSDPQSPGRADIISSGLGRDFAQPVNDFTSSGGHDFATTSSPAQPSPGAPKRSSGGTSLRDKAIAAAMAVLGTPYSWGGGSTSGASYGIQQGSNIKGFDCSGLLLYAFAQAGYSIPRLSYDQLDQGTRTSIDNLQPGDLVGFHNGSHIAMYIGNGQIIESPRTGLTVRVRSLGSNENAFGVHLDLPGD